MERQNDKGENENNECEEQWLMIVMDETRGSSVGGDYIGDNEKMEMIGREGHLNCLCYGRPLAPYYPLSKQRERQHSNLI